MAIGAGVVGAVLSVGVAMTVAGAWPLYKGWQRRGRYQLVKDTPTASPATATTGETVLLTGTATPHGSPVSAPLSGVDAALATWSIREWQDENLDMKYWTEEGSGLRSATIRIGVGDDAVTFPERFQEGTTDLSTSVSGYDAVTGLDVEDTVVEIDAFDTTEDVPQADDPPERFRDLERQIGLDAPDPGVTIVDLGRTHGTRRYREAVIEEGDTVTIRGTVRTTTDPEASRVVTAPDDGPVIISNLDPDALSRRYRRSYRKLFYGTICVIFATMLIVGLALAA